MKKHILNAKHTEIDSITKNNIQDSIVHPVTQYKNDKISGYEGNNIQINNSTDNSVKNEAIYSDEANASNLAKLKKSSKLLDETFNKENTQSEILTEQGIHLYKIHGRLRKFVSKLKKTRRVCKLMTKILKGYPIQKEEFVLEPFEITLLTSMMERKYNNTTIQDDMIVDNKFNKFMNLIDDRKLNYNIDFLSIEDPLVRTETMKNLVDFIQSLKLIRRIEDNNKFVYKHTTSYLLTQFVNKNDLKFNNTSENLYYQCYFGDYAKNTDLNIFDFCDPSKTHVKGSRNAKSLNTEYMLRILSCTKYKEKFFNYLQTDFVEHYLSAIYKKLEGMLMVLEERWARAPEHKHEHILTEYIDTKIKQKWCKIPWSHTEVQASVSHFICYFSNLLLRQKLQTNKTQLRKLNSAKIIQNPQFSIKNDNEVKCTDLSRRSISKITIQHIGTILNYKKAKKYSLSLFEPSDLILNQIKKKKRFN